MLRPRALLDLEALKALGCGIPIYIKGATKDLRVSNSSGARQSKCLTNLALLLHF